MTSIVTAEGVTIEVADGQLSEIEELRADLKHAHKVMTELKQFQITGKPGEILMEMKTDLFVAFVAAVGEVLRDYDAENFLVMEFAHPTIGPLNVTIQKCGAKSVTQELGELRARIAELEGQLANSNLEGSIDG